MPLDMKAGLGPGDFALRGTQLSLLKKTAAIFGHAYCDQTAGWIKRLLRTKVGLGLVDIVLDGGPSSLPSKEGYNPPFLANVRCGQTAR